MKIKYLGHAAFELNLEDGTSVVFDPYESGSYDGALAYGPITGNYDVAVVSHDHPDHRDAGVIERAKSVVDAKGSVELAGIRVSSFPTYHDESGGAERGANLISIVEAEGLRIAHLGDLGHAISAGEIPELERVDVALVPVGGHFTIDASTAASIISEFEPKLVIPMHFKTARVGFPIEPVDVFTGLMENVERAEGSEITVTRENLPPDLKVVVLDPSL